MDTVEEGKWIAFKPAFELPADALIDVHLDKAPSEEGPEVMDSIILPFQAQRTFQVTSSSFTWAQFLEF